MRILLVEDDSMIGASVRQGLRQDGFTVDWARDGRAAELAIENGVYDLLLDLGLPRKINASNLPAANAGIQPGDMILSLNGTPVKSPEQLKLLLGKAGKHVALLVQRDDAKTFIPVDLG